MRRRTAWSLSLLLIVTACSGTGDDPTLRAAAVRTIGCGLASAETGSGVVVDAETVLTAAHIVGRASGVIVNVGESEYPAQITHWDRDRDIAILQVPGHETARVPFADATEGDTVTMVGGRTSGTQQGEITLWAELTIEAVMSDERVSRLGYQVDLASADGDSGAGVFDADGHLIGLVFAVETESRLTWVTAASEAQTVLAGPASTYECDPDRSQIVERTTPGA